MTWLIGKRTYILAIGIGIAAVLHELGYLSEEAYHTISGILGAGSLMTLRAGVKQTEVAAQKTEAAVQSVERKL